MTELWQLGALELAARIAGGDVTSREVLEAHLDRVDRVNPHLNAIVRILADEARAAADAADRAVREGGPLGRFLGVPITVKENIDVAGAPTTQAIPALAEAIAALDAPTVARMRAAGAIPFARTNMPDVGLRIHTDSALYGLTRNPWDPTVTAGGSSGGEGSALAAGMSPLGLGNDIGGSLRNPAHCNGIVSIKPSTGVVPMATVVPPVDRLLSSQLMLAEGPMARHVADVRAALEILAGPDRRDPTSMPVTLTDAAEGERLRIAVVAEPPGGGTDPGIAAAVRRAADVLADAGHDVVEATPPWYEEIFDWWGALLAADVRAQRPILELVIADAALAAIATLEERAPELDVTGLADVHMKRFMAMRDWSTFFADHPVVLSPTWARRAFAHGRDIGAGAADAVLETFRPVLAANFLGLPAAVVPCGTDAGLPVGVQVIGDRFTDLRCLAVAEQIEDVVGRITPIDPVTA